MNRTVVFVLCLFMLGLAALGTGCTNQKQSNLTSTSSSSPTVTRTSTSVVASSDNCIVCHTNQSTLEKLATKVIVTSTETSGEG